MAYNPNGDHLQVRYRKQRSNLPIPSYASAESISERTEGSGCLHYTTEYSSTQRYHRSPGQGDQVLEKCRQTHTQEIQDFINHLVSPNSNSASDTTASESTTESNGSKNPSASVKLSGAALAMWLKDPESSITQPRKLGSASPVKPVLKATRATSASYQARNLKELDPTAPAFVPAPASAGSASTKPLDPSAVPFVPVGASYTGSEPEKKLGSTGPVFASEWRLPTQPAECP